MRVLAPLAAVLLLACVASPARSEDDPGQPLVRVPDYGVEAISPGADEHPEGWSALSDDAPPPAAAPTVGAVLAAAARAGIGEARVAVRAIPWQREAGGVRSTAMLTLVSVDERPDAFTAAIVAAAKEHGWLVREMGSPLRVLLVWCSDVESRGVLRDWLVDRVVRRTMERAVEHILEAGRSGDRARWSRGGALIERAAHIEPRAGFVHAVKGRMVPAEKPDEALAHYRAAVRSDAPVPAPPDWRSTAAARLGQILLERSKEVDEARAALELAVELEAHIQSPLERFGARYNLACVLVRLGRKDEALPHLDAALAFAREHLGAEYAFHHEHARSRDPDMEPLRADPRFVRILERHAPGRGHDAKQEREAR